MHNPIHFACKKPSYFRISEALFVLLVVLIAQSSLPSSVKSQVATHSVFVEVFTSTWCEPCREEQLEIRRLSTNNSNLAHFVVFHLQDSWSTTDAVERANELGFNFVPSHAYDGGYVRTSGTTIDTSELMSLASRSVHLIELTVTKAINGSVLNAQVAIAERNGYSFSGEVIAYVVEDGITASGVRWNSIYESQVVRQGVFLKPNSYQVLYGNWSIPAGTEPTNLMVVAVAFDKNSQGKYGFYAVQSACDADSNVAIPEFEGLGLPVVASALLIAVMIIRTVGLRRRITA